MRQTWLGQVDGVFLDKGENPTTGRRRVLPGPSIASPKVNRVGKMSGNLTWGLPPLAGGVGVCPGVGLGAGAGPGAGAGAGAGELPPPPDGAGAGVLPPPVPPPPPPDGAGAGEGAGVGATTGVLSKKV